MTGPRQSWSLIRRREDIAVILLLPFPHSFMHQTWSTFPHLGSWSAAEAGSVGHQPQRRSIGNLSLLFLPLTRHSNPGLTTGAKRSYQSHGKHIKWNVPHMQQKQPNQALTSITTGLSGGASWTERKQLWFGQPVREQERVKEALMPPVYIWLAHRKKVQCHSCWLKRAPSQEGRRFSPLPKNELRHHFLRGPLLSCSWQEG